MACAWTRRIAGAFALVSLLAGPAGARQEPGDKLAAAADLKKLSIEELMDIDVTSVSRRTERLNQAAAVGADLAPLQGFPEGRIEGADSPLGRRGHRRDGQGEREQQGCAAAGDVGQESFCHGTAFYHN